LSEDEITFVKETIKVIEDKPITWTVVCGEFRHPSFMHISRAIKND